MSNEVVLSESIRRFHTSSDKLEYYRIALTFTLLALAVESADFTSSLIPSAFELGAWSLLFVSGVLGLSRLDHASWLHFLVVSREQAAIENSTLSQMAVRGERAYLGTDPLDPESSDLAPRSLAAGLQVNEIKRASIDEGIERTQRKASSRGRWGNFLFIAGLMAMMIARGWDGLSRLAVAVGL
ncbi:MAG: hypothetical protein AAF170_07715 [Bacteroidota bacterium]